jgi:hypothetical protein
MEIETKLKFLVICIEDMKVVSYLLIHICVPLEVGGLSK